MRKYYSEEQEKRYGVVEIHVSVIDFEGALTRQKQIREAAFERPFFRWNGITLARKQG